MSYSQINWENKPSTKTPINAENLKHMDEGIAKAHEIAEELETYKANSIITTTSGTTFHETDCAAVPPINIKLFGKGTQKTYTGKNMFNFNGKYATSGCTVEEVLDNGFIVRGKTDGAKPGQSVASSGWFTVGAKSTPSNWIYLEEGELVTVSADYTVLENSLGTTENISIHLAHLEEDGKSHTPNAYIPIPAVNVKTRICYTFTKKNSGYFIPRFTLNSCLVKIENVQIALGTDTEYEPYVGNQPSPNIHYPQEVTRLGEGGSIVGTIKENGLTFTALTPNGLGGIPLGQTIPDAIKNSPIHMAGVYWDEGEGQYYIGDTKNENGKDVQRIARKVFAGTEKISYYAVKQGNLFRFGTKNNTPALLLYFYDPACGMCNYYLAVRAAYRTNGTVSGIYTSELDFIDDRFSDAESFKAELARLYAEGKPVYVDYILAEPIVTDLTAEEIAQYNSVHMNYPNTTIVNDAGAHMEVEYVADTKKHIEKNYVSKEAYNEHENRIAELEKAIVNS